MWSLKLKDFIKGLAISILTSVAYIVQSSLDAGILQFKWKQIAMAAAAAAVAYIIKQLVTDDVKVAEKTLSNEATKTDQSFYITPKK